jgi:hypothetical protein
MLTSGPPGAVGAIVTSGSLLRCFFCGMGVGWGEAGSASDTWIGAFAALDGLLMREK